MTSRRRLPSDATMLPAPAAPAPWPPLMSMLEPEKRSGAPDRDRDLEAAPRGESCDVATGQSPPHGGGPAGRQRPAPARGDGRYLPRAGRVVVEGRRTPRGVKVKVHRGQGHPGLIEEQQHKYK